MKTMSSLFENQPLTRFYNKGNDFSFEAPMTWIHEYHPDSEHSNIFQVSEPCESGVVIGASGYNKKPGMSLRAFADARQGMVDDVFKAVASEQGFPEVFYREYEGMVSDQGKAIALYYVTCAIETTNGFISLTIGTTRDEFVKNTGLYKYIMSSCQ